MKEVKENGKDRRNKKKKTLPSETIEPVPSYAGMDGRIESVTGLRIWS